MKRNIILCIIVVILVITLLLIIFVKKDNNSQVDNIDNFNGTTGKNIIGEYKIYNEISGKLETVYIENEPFEEDIVSNRELFE